MNHEKNRRWLILATVLIGTVSGTLGNSMANVALPDVMDHFQVDISRAAWMVTIYILFFAVPLPIVGRLGDMYGYKRIYTASMSVFVLASLGASLAPTFPALIVLRALQGLANAPTLPSVMAIVTNVFPTEERGRAMGVWALANSASHAIGPPLSGFLTQYFGWSSIFYVNVALSLAGVFLVWRLVPQDEQRGGDSFDYVGALTLTLATLALMFNLTQGPKMGWTSPLSLSLWAVFALLIGGFLLVERTVQSPFVELSLFGNRPYTAATAVVSLQLFCQFGLALIMPLFLMRIQGYTSGQAGLLVFPLPITMALVAPLAGRLADSIGCRKTCLTGMGLVALAGLALLPLGPGTAWWYVVAVLALMGVGMGMIQSPTAAAVTQVVNQGRLGLALGLFNMFRFIGGTLGATIFGLVLGAFSERWGLVSASRLNFGLVVVLALVAFLTALSVPDRPKLETLSNP